LLVAVVICVIAIAIPLVLGMVGWIRAAVWNRRNQTGTRSATAAPWVGPVWLMDKPPRIGFRAMTEKARGTLRVTPSSGIAAFEGTSGETLVLARLAHVEMGRRGSDIVNTWIEVSTLDDGTPTTLFLNDGAWLGWRSLVTGSNMRLATALASLANPPERSTVT